MCSRFEMNSPREELAQAFPDLLFPDDFPGGEIRPTNDSLVIAATARVEILRWGLPAPWDGKPLINARAETLRDKPTFRAYVDNRCLIPATAYFEWRQVPGGKRKNRIRPAAPLPFIFAGLFGDGAFTVLTCAPAPSIAHIHTRMPVILDRPHFDAWLRDGDPALLAPYTGDIQAAEDIPAQGSLFE